MTQQFHSLQLIALSDLEYSERWSIHPFLKGQIPSQLQDSIERTGILHPPIIQKITPEKYHIISGHLRIQALLNTSPPIGSVPCLLLPQSTSPHNILDYIIEDQLLTGSFSPMEKAFFFKLCGKYMDNSTIAATYRPILQENLQKHTITKVLQFVDMDQKLQLSVHTGQVSDKLAWELLSLSSSDRKIVHEMFVEFGIGAGKQKRLLSLCRDLAGRLGQSIEELLSSPDLEDICNHDEMNPPQKAMRLMTTLQRRLCPESIAAEEEFTKQVAAMNLPRRCSISHSQSFESDEVSLTIRFANFRSMNHKLSTIQKLSTSKNS